MQTSQKRVETNVTLCFGAVSGGRSAPQAVIGWRSRQPLIRSDSEALDLVDRSFTR
jgi:hypothetical protein